MRLSPEDTRTFLHLLGECRSAGSMKPLYAYRDSLPDTPEGESDQAAKVNRLLDLLKLPRESPR